MNFGISDLKKAYRRNMLIGFVAAGLFFVSLFTLALAWTGENEEAGTVILVEPRPDTLVVMPPVPPRPTETIHVKTEPPPKPPEIGIIVAVEDSLVEEGGKIPTQNQLQTWVPEQPSFDPAEYASEDNIKKVLETLLPQPGVFVPRDVDPVKIHPVRPVYPALPQHAGIEGDVWLQALVDKEGIVRDVIIMKCTNPNAGFEEAAIAAAYKTTWKPAIANGLPVAVWVTYKVEFVLR